MREAERREAEREERLRVARALGVLLRAVAEPGQFLRRLVDGDDPAARERVRVWTMAENPGIVGEAALLLRAWWNRPVEVGEWDYGSPPNTRGSTHQSPTGPPTPAVSPAHAGIDPS